MPFPESVQALIAARLDTLDPEAKSLLADAAVIGKVFWAGAVSAMGDRDPQTVTTTLRELSRKELVRPSRQSSMAGEAEYAFWHVLARDVAYNQLPRASRATRHVAAASGSSRKHPSGSKTWPMCSPTTTRPPWSSPRQPGKPTRPPSWKHPRCASSAWPESAPSGSTPPRPSRVSSERWRSPRRGIPQRAAALARFGEAALARRTLRRGEETRWRRRSQPSRRPAIVAAPRPGDGHAQPWCSTGSGIRAGGTLPAEALALLEPLPPGPEQSRALTELAARRGAARPERSRDRLRRAGALARRSNSASRDPPAPSAIAAWPRCHLGDRGGLDDFREAITLATEAGQGREVGDPAQQPRRRALGVRRPRCAALEVIERGSRSRRPAASPGSTDGAHRQHARPARSIQGQHEQALDLAAELATASRGKRDLLDLTSARGAASQILTLRGQASQVADTLDWLETTSREAGASRRTSSPASAPPPSPAPHSHNPTTPPPCSPRSRRPRRRENAELRRAACQRWCAPPSRIGNPELAQQLIDRRRAPHPLPRTRPHHRERRPRRSPRPPPGSRRRLRRRRPALADLRRRPRASLRPPRPGPLPRRARPHDRGRPAPPPGPRHLPGATGRPGARRNRRAPPTGDRAQLLEAGGPTPPFGRAFSRPSPLCRATRARIRLRPPLAANGDARLSLARLAAVDLDWPRPGLRVGADPPRPGDLRPALRAQSGCPRGGGRVVDTDRASRFRRHGDGHACHVARRHPAGPFRHPHRRSGRGHEYGGENDGNHHREATLHATIISRDRICAHHPAELFVGRGYSRSRDPMS